MKAFRMLLRVGCVAAGRVVVVVVLLVLQCGLRGVRATHFRGVHIWWAPTQASQRQVIISYRVAWRRTWGEDTYCDFTTIDSRERIGPASGYMMCYDGCTEQIGDMLFYCTDFSLAEEWSAGIGSHVHNFTGTGTYVVGWEGRGWLSGVHFGDDVAWSVRMVVDLRERSDTGAVNSSPFSAVTPVVRAQHGCQHTLKLPVTDPDEGDIVRCRWGLSSRSECGGVCNVFQEATLDEETCNLSFGDTVNAGYYAVALQLEDYPKGTLIFNTPLSSVPLQFLIYVYDASGADCNAAPVFIDPTPEEDSCFALDPGVQHKIVIAARSKDEFTIISDIETVSSIGMRKSEVGRLGTDLRDHYVNVTWTPSESQTGQKIFCFSAIDGPNRISSEQRCVYLMIGYPEPEAESISYEVDIRQVTIKFNQEIARASWPRKVRVYDYDNGDLLVTLNTNILGAVTVYDSVLSFVLPVSYLTANITAYVTLETGVVTGLLRCGADSKPVSDSRLLFNTQGLEVHTTYAPTQEPITSAPVTGHEGKDYTWLIVTLVILVLVFGLGVLIAVLVRKRKKDKGEYQREERQHEYARSVAAKMSSNEAYEPDFNDIDVKFR